VLTIAIARKLNTAVAKLNQLNTSILVSIWMNFWRFFFFNCQKYIDIDLKLNNCYCCTKAIVVVVEEQVDGCASHASPYFADLGDLVIQHASMHHKGPTNSLG
jgi:hypothetical protein